MKSFINCKHDFSDIWAIKEKTDTAGLWQI